MTNRPLDIDKLVRLVAHLRGPDGCPWDRKQSLSDLRAYLLEEAHEAAATIDSGKLDELCSELGDLLFQVVFIAQLGQEQGAFALQDVIDRIHDKMIERHPHVFGDAVAEDAKAVQQAWEKRKFARQDAHRSLLDGVPPSLPALVAAFRLTQKAAGIGFDWPDARAVLAKVHEELAECEEALAKPVAERHAALGEEVGDLLFSVANLARHLELDPEAALARGNHKFKRRFAVMERLSAERGQDLSRLSLDELDQLWEEAKAATAPSTDQS